MLPASLPAAMIFDEAGHIPHIKPLDDEIKPLDDEIKPLDDEIKPLDESGRRPSHRPSQKVGGMQGAYRSRQA
jgi:hypothetical protein